MDRLPAEGKHIAHSTVQLRSVDDIQQNPLTEVSKCHAMILLPLVGMYIANRAQCDLEYISGLNNSCMTMLY